MIVTALELDFWKLNGRILGSYQKMFNFYIFFVILSKSALYNMCSVLWK